MMKILKRKNKKGFTLMEMLIVVGIIAILVAIAIPTFGGAQKKAKYTADVANVRAWFGEALAKNMAEGTDLPGSCNVTPQFTATIRVSGTTAETFKVTYDSSDPDTTRYPDVTFPSDATPVPAP